MRRIISLLVLSISVAIFLLSGCDQNKASTGVESFKPDVKLAAVETIKIGAILSVTGPASFLGAPEKKTLNMLAKQINDAGGIGGRLIELLIIDTQADPTKAVLAANKLAGEGVLAILGPSTSGESLAIIDIVEKAKIPLIAIAASRKIIEPVKPYVFKAPQSDRLAVMKIFDHMKAAGKSKAAIITVSNSFGQSGRGELKNLSKDYGIEIVADEVYAPKDTDMTVQLTKISGSKAEAIICWDTNPGPAIVARNVQQLGIKAQIYMSHGVASRKFLELAGEAANGIVHPAGHLIVARQLSDDDPQKDLLLKYTRDYEANYPDDAVSNFGGHAYDGLLLIIEAIKSAGADREKIRSHLETIKNFVGTGGVFNFSPTDHNGLDKSSFIMIEIVNNDWKLIKE